MSVQRPPVTRRRPAVHAPPARPRGNAEVWWLHPGYFVLLITLPAFVISYMVGKSYVRAFGSLDFLSLQTVLTGSACLLTIFVGVVIGMKIPPRASSATAGGFDQRRAEVAVYALLLLSIAAHIVLLWTLALRPDLIMSALAGSRGATAVLKASLNRIPGVTSATQAYLLALPLIGAYSVYGEGRRPLAFTYLVAILLFLVVVRAIFTSERFALIEVTLCLFIPLVAFQLHRSRAYKHLPWVGGGFIFLLFAAAEYIRSWQYYKSFYASYIEFISLRFLGYLVTASNNAAGLLDMFGPMGQPWFTARWLRRLPGLEGARSEGSDDYRLFLEKFANAEFNNPSGIFSPVLDYGVAGGMLCWFVIALIGGVLYNLFRRKTPIGVLLFPGFFVGFVALTQFFYWGDPRYFPALVLSLPVLLFVTKRKPIMRRMFARGQPASP
jgi:oligosaccharide repeat unit polymerase